MDIRLPNMIRQSPTFKRLKVVMRPVTDTIGRILRSMADDNIALISGGVAFYAFLSIFPGIAFALMLWGIFYDSDDLAQHFNVLSDVVPPSMFNLIAGQLTEISETRSWSLSRGAAISLVIVLWSSSRAVNALLSAMWVTSKGRMRRGFFRQNAAAFTFTFVGMLYALASLVILGAIQAVIESLRIGEYVDAFVQLVRWLTVFALFFTGVLIFYRVSHPRDKTGVRITPDRQWPGALLAAMIWLATSFGFSFYLQHFDALNKTFGSLGAVVALLLWLWITAFAICAGAETNSELSVEEKQ